MGTGNLTRKSILKNKESAISDFLLQSDYPITVEFFHALASDFSKFKLLIKESLLIKHEKPIFNRATKSFPLDLFYEVFSACFS